MLTVANKLTSILFLPHEGGRLGWGCNGCLMPLFIHLLMFTPTLTLPLKEGGDSSEIARWFGVPPLALPLEEGGGS